MVDAYSTLSYDIGRLSIALADVGVLILLVKFGLIRWLTSRLGAVGQMALTNYLMHSVVCSTNFCGSDSRCTDGWSGLSSTMWSRDFGYSR